MVSRSKFIPYTKEELKNEEWRIVSLNPAYMVSDIGRIKRIDTGKIRHQNTTLDGYLTSNVSGSKSHRLVALAFIDNPDNKETVNHIDGNKQNNRKSNLEWSSRKENSHHAVMSGLWTNNYLIELTDITTKEVIKFMSMVKLGKYLNIHPMTILSYAKNSFKKPILNKYIIKLGKNILEPFNASGKEKVTIWVSDLITKEWKLYPSMMSLVYNTGLNIAHISKSLSNKPFFIQAGYLVCKDKVDEYIPKNIDKEALVISRYEFESQEFNHKPEVTYYLYDYTSKTETTYETLDSIVMFLNTKPMLDVIVNKVSVIGVISRGIASGEANVLKGYGVKSSLNEVPWGDKTLGYIIASKHGKDLRGTVFEITDNLGSISYVFGDVNMARYLSTESNIFTKGMVNHSIYNNKFQELVKKSNVSNLNIKIIK